MKIKDRFWLSLVAGIGGTMIKSVLVRSAIKMKWAEFNGSETAAGMLVPAHKIYTTQGKVIGEIGNLIVGVGFSLPIIYLLSLTGRDKALLKGASAGMGFWALFYGSLANLGLSSTRPALPQTVLTNLIAHTIYGGAVSLIATRLGDPGLFDGSIPLTTSVQKKRLQRLPETVEWQETPLKEGKTAETTADLH